MNLNFLRRQAIISSQARKKNLPYLCELEYLESTGEQWITIPYQIKATDTFRHETANQYTQFGTTQYEGQTSAGNWYGINPTGKYTIGGDITSTFTASTTDFDNIVAESNDTGLTLTVNDVVVGTRNSKSSGTKLYLFDCFNPNSAVTSTSYLNFVRKRYHKFYVNGELYFDGIPVLDYDMKPAMYDRVTKTFFYNEGTGADFKYGLKDNEGNLYTSVSYLESTGAQWIKLNKKLELTDNTRHETSIMVTQTGTLQREGYAIATRWYGIAEDGVYTLGSTGIGTVASTADYDHIVFDTVSDGTRGTANFIVNGQQTLQRSANMNAIPNTCLFAGNVTGDTPCYIRKKYHKFYVNNKPYFIGVPVINTDGKPAMFDTVTKKPFYNAGSGADFTIGE